MTEVQMAEQQQLPFEQDEHLERVTSRIGRAILDFFERTEPQFHAEDLRRYIKLNVGEVAPGSPDRIMRLLRKAGRIDYVVLNRRESQYRIVRAEQ
jgi:hypothetical protein